MNLDCMTDGDEALLLQTRSID